ncbi:MAG: phospholipid carrier-dependent glycosyltransferase [Clostridia bacterium]|nr:phospholipid carrier-dependent glycosyltransferase [Clostridia bacterium]
MRKLIKPLALLAMLCIVILMASGCASTVPKGQNCLTNSSFSQSSSSAADGWYFEAYANTAKEADYVKNAGPNGETAVKISLTQANDARIVQEVACKPNTLYKFTVLCKTQDVADTGTGANISVIGVFTPSTQLKGTSDWTTLELYGRTASTQTTLTVALRLGFYSGDTTGTAYFTNASMTEIDASAVPGGVTPISLENRLATTPENNVDPKLSATSTEIIVGGILFALIFIGAYYLLTRFKTPSSTTRLCILVVLICIGLIVRFVNAMDYKGFEVDFNCFWSWGARMISQGPFEFYSSTSFCDYPPLYMLMLSIPSALISLFGLGVDSTAGWLLIKLFPILFDVGISIFVFKFAEKHLPKVSLLLAGAFLLNPAVIVNSASWGQVDSVFMLFILLAIYYLIKNKLWISVCWYAVALLLKPQALLFAPVMLLGAITIIIKAYKGELDADLKASRKEITRFACAMGGILAVFIIFSVAMQNDLEWYWLISKYFSTMGEYKYAALSAFNYLTLLGGQWASIDKEITFENPFAPEGQAPLGLGVTFGQLGFTLLILVIALFVFLYFFKKRTSFKNMILGSSTRNLFLLSALLIAGLFVMGPYMHERYLFPVLALLLAAFIVHKDTRLLFVFAGFSATSFINVAQVLFLHCENHNRNGLAYFAADDPLLLAGSIINVLIFAFFVYVAIDITLSGERMVAKSSDSASERVYSEPVTKRDELLYTLGKKADKKPFFTWKDWAIMLTVTVLYAVISLATLGSANTPEHYWDAELAQSVTVDFGESVNVQRYLINTSIVDASEGKILIEYSNDGITYSQLSSYSFKNGDMYKWVTSKSTYTGTSARYVRVTAKAGAAKLNELTFYSSAEAEEPIKIVSATSDGVTLNADELAAYREHGALALFNEQSTAVPLGSYYTGMIFDEIYHARTAYEMINGWRIYEWTHPPLGKAIMSLGIRMFGMNPFGWRFMGNLMGILMLPAIYCFGKLLFKKTSWASVLMLIMAFDGMHYIQTRLATIDSYGVFFIILMYLFMYKYYTMSWSRDEFWKTLIPLGLSGISFGLGVASKWIGAYAGVGLAVLFFFTIYKRISEFAVACKHVNDPDISDAQRDQLLAIKRSTWIYFGITIAFCVAFFVVIPLIIYCASYGAYFDAPGNKGSWLNTIIKNQTDMLSYHQGITSDDNYWQSKWYTWPIMWHPYWYYQAQGLSGDRMGTISCMGNPLVWWFGLVSAISSAVIFIKRLVNIRKAGDPALKARMRKDMHLLGFVFIGLAANYGAWMLVPRSTFIYHYFASLPFIMIFAVYILRQAHSYISLKHPKLANAAVIAFVVACGVLACMFYPVWTGIETSKEYVSTWLWWIPSYSVDKLGQGWHFFNP